MDLSFNPLFIWSFAALVGDARYVFVYFAVNYLLACGLEMGFLVYKISGSKTLPRSPYKIVHGIPFKVQRTAWFQIETVITHVTRSVPCSLLMVHSGESSNSILQNFSSLFRFFLDKYIFHLFIQEIKKPQSLIIFFYFFLWKMCLPMYKTLSPHVWLDFKTYKMR